MLILILCRYGWTPLPDEVAEAIVQKYNWIFPLSVTHMEILHGAYRRCNPNAAFFIRDPSMIDNIPQQYRSQFCENNPLSNLQLKVILSNYHGRCSSILS